MWFALGGDASLVVRVVTVRVLTISVADSGLELASAIELCSGECSWKRGGSGDINASTASSQVSGKLLLNRLSIVQIVNTVNTKGFRSILFFGTFAEFLCGIL